MSLAKKFKISSGLRIEIIIKKGFRFRSRYFQLKYLPNNRNFNRFCAVAPGTLCKTAVKRNFLRRRVYETIRLNWKNDRKPCYDIVVLCLKDSPKALYSDLSKDIIACAKQLSHE